MATPGCATSAVDTPSVPYSVTSQEQAFIDGVLTPKFAETGEPFDAEVEKLRATWEQGMASEFSAVRAQLESEVTQIFEMM